MKKTIRLIVSALTSVSMLMMLSSCGASKMVQNAAGNGFGDYTVENAGIGRDGTYVLKVNTRSLQPDTELLITEKNAVHAVLFTGIPAGGGFGAAAPIAGSASAESANKVFFENFFASDYRRFIKTVSRSSMVIVKNKKDKSYTTSAVVSVLKDDLRHHLENNGIISHLSL